MADELLVIKQDEEVTFDERGHAQEWIRVTFKVGVHGPFLERFPKVGFTAVAARQRLEERARQVRELGALR